MKCTQLRGKRNLTARMTTATAVPIAATAPVATRDCSWLSLRGTVLVAKRSERIQPLQSVDSPKYKNSPRSSRRLLSSQRKHFLINSTSSRASKTSRPSRKNLESYSFLNCYHFSVSLPYSIRCGRRGSAKFHFASG